MELHTVRSNFIHLSYSIQSIFSINIRHSPSILSVRILDILSILDNTWIYLAYIERLLTGISESDWSASE
jgi:hypothetical protein